MKRDRVLAGLALGVWLVAMVVSPRPAVAEGDTTPPVITATRSVEPNTAGWYNTAVTITFLCTDETALTSCSPPVTVTTEGRDQQITGTAVDAAGNTSTVSVSVSLDLTPPTTGYDGGANRMIYCIATDNLSGLLSTYYSVDGGPTVQGHQVQLDVGPHTITFWSIDVAGNVEPAQTYDIYVNGDQTPPTITATLKPLLNANGWSRYPVRVDFYCSDAESSIVYCSPSIYLSTEGAGQSATGTAEDAYGNTATVTVTDIHIDMTAPFLAMELSPAQPNAYNWFNTDVAVSWAYGDTLSGIDPATIPPAQLLTAEGSFTVAGDVFDLAGNGTRRTLQGIRIDKTPPETIPDFDYSHTLYLGARDNLSGVSNTNYQVDGGPVQSSRNVARIDLPYGTHTITYWSVDYADNVEPARSETVFATESTPPTITASRSPAPNAYGWNNSDVTVTFTCSDSESGVASCTEPQTVRTEGRSQTVTGTASDNAGNYASVTVTDINIDKTAPLVAYGGNAGTYTVDQTVSITCTATDGLAGVAGSTCSNLNAPAYGFQPTNSLSASATDRAGNTGSATATFAVRATYDSLCTLTRQFSASAKTADNLCSKLYSAQKAEARGDLARKAQYIQQYIDSVNAQVGKALTADEAATLVRWARTL